MRLGLDYFESLSPEEFFKDVSSDENISYVVEIMKRLSDDPVWSKQIIDPVSEGKIETRCFVAWLAKILQPETYLELGVRRGFSMAMVAAQCRNTEIYGFDQWDKDYGYVPNPGPKFVQSEMEKLGYGKRVNFINGNSHKTLTSFFRNLEPSFLERMKGAKVYRDKPRTMDLILIDGDHSVLGGYWDLLDALPNCSVGGAVIFDDIAPDLSQLGEEDLELVHQEGGEDPFGWGNLFGVWCAVKRLFGCFKYYEYVDSPPGVGVAIRLE